MPNYLFLLGSFFPKPSANGICSNEVMQELLKSGNSASCICIKSRGQHDNDEISGVKINRVRPRLSSRVLEWSELNNTHIVKRILATTIYMLNTGKSLLYYPLWPFLSPLVAYRMYRQGALLVKERRISHIVAVHKPIECLIAGALLKRKFKDTMLSYYFLDPLSGGVPPRIFSEAWLKKRGLRWEKTLFKSSDVIYILKAHAKHYLEHYEEVAREKIEIVDIPLVRDMRSNSNSLIKLNNGSMNLVYTGTFIRGLRSPGYFLKLLDNLKHDSSIVFHIYGSGDCDEEIRNYSELIKEGKIRQYGRVPPAKSYEAMFSADCLVNIGSENNILIPSKIFEYISSGKPIISTYSVEDDPSIPYLAKYPNVLIIKEDWGRISENSLKLKEFLSQPLKDTEFNFIEKLYSQNTPKHMAEIMLGSKLEAK